ncbi:hypothetical protein GQ457_06G024630 [Hibiscus cannabinus]
MEFVNKLAALATRAANNNVVLDVCLVTTFSVLCIRSLNQQNVIESLEAERDSLTKANKTMKKTMWDWKQQLFAEASSDSPLVPLAKLKAIYGESTTPSTGDAVKEGGKSPPTKFIV